LSLRPEVAVRAAAAAEAAADPEAEAAADPEAAAAAAGPCELRRFRRELHIV